MLRSLITIEDKVATFKGDCIRAAAKDADRLGMYVRDLRAGVGGDSIEASFWMIIGALKVWSEVLDDVEYQTFAKLAIRYKRGDTSKSEEDLYHHLLLTITGSKS